MGKINEPGSGFVRQLMQSQNQIYSFILTLVPNWSDADDIMQDTAEVLWRKYGQDIQIENFTGLGIRVAQNLIFNYYRKKKRQEWFLEEQALEDIAQYAERLTGDADSRIRMLHQCLKKLANPDKELIRLRYEEGLKVKTIANVSKRSEDGLYKALGRIHEAIMRCIKRGLALENY